VASVAAGPAATLDPALDDPPLWPLQAGRDHGAARHGQARPAGEGGKAEAQHGAERSAPLQGSPASQAVRTADPASALRTSITELTARFVDDVLHAVAKAAHDALLSVLGDGKKTSAKATGKRARPSSSSPRPVTSVAGVAAKTRGKKKVTTPPTP
jgi:hypothetical protein